MKSAPSSRPRSRTGAGADFQQSEFESTGHGLGAVGGVQVCEEGGDVGPHGPLRDAEQPGDLVVAEPLADEAEHLELALGDQAPRRLGRRSESRG